MNRKLAKLAYGLRRPETRRALQVARVAPSLELRGLLKDVRPFTVVDVGANAGQFSLLALTELEASRVIAFEPLSAAAARFRRVFEADDRVTLHQIAVGSTRGDAQLHVSAADDSSSLLPISDRQVAAFPGTHQVRLEKIKIAPLMDLVQDEDLAPPSLLKVDVQGYEIETLRGCEELLHHFDHVLVEASFDELYEGQPVAGDVIAWMAERGLAVSRASTSTARSTDVPVQGDFLFHPARKVTNGA